MRFRRCSNTFGRLLIFGMESVERRKEERLLASCMCLFLVLKSESQCIVSTKEEKACADVVRRVLAC